jgi:preprotein translocase subunit YajC
MQDLDVLTLTLAQDGAVDLPGESTAAPGGTPAEGTPTGRPASIFDGPFLLLLVGMVVFMLIISSLGPRRERKKREAMIRAIKKHDRVQTVGGVIGAIVEIKPDFVVLKVDESSNTRITFARSAIQQVLSSGPETPPAAEE